MNDIEKKLEKLPIINYKHVFFGFNNNLETEFTDNLISDSLGMIRFNLVMIFIIYTAFGIIDIFINPFSRHLSWLICPYVLFCFIFSFFKFFKKFIPLSIILLCVISTSGIFIITILNKNIGFMQPLYFSGLIMIVILVYTGLRIRFIYSSLIGISIVIIYEIFNIFINKIFYVYNGTKFFINDSFFIIVANNLGMIVSFYLEYYMRHSFLLRKRIQYEEELKKNIAEQELLRIKQERDIIKKLDSLKDDFIANVSHEIRTPLTLIIGPLEAILSKVYGTTFSYNDVRIKAMYYNGLKLLKLINNILDFSKIDAGKIKVEKQKIKISQLLRFYVATIKTSIENQGLDIIYVDNAGIKFIVYTDKNILEKAVFNLISNALKFTPKGGQVTVQLDNRENFYDISIKDTGIGIPGDKINEIFKRFHQLDDQPSKKYDGTGIGLALTKELIESLGGKISVRSKLNEGSIFTITLPYEIIKDNDMELTEKYFEIKQHLLPNFENDDESMNDKDMKFKYDKKIVLVVEDNPDMQKYIKSILCEKYIVNIAKNGKEGLEKIYKNKPDLILADIMMSEMDGYQMTKIIKSSEELKGIPVILLTAKSEMSMKIKGFRKGAEDYIVKPFNTKELLARINSHLEINRLRDEAIRRKENMERMLNEKIIAQKHLEESEKRFREMAENLPVSIIENDMDNNILYLNKYSKQLFNISLKDNLLDFINTTGNEKFFNNMKELHNTGIIELCECKLKTKDGNNMTALIKSIMLFDQDKPKGVRSTIMEIEPNYNILLMPDKNFCMKYNITERENEIIILLIKGLSYTQIGEKLFISYKTVDNHISNIYRKTNVNNRNQLVELIQKN